MSDRPKRTAYCEVWDEKRTDGNHGGPFELALQLVHVFDSGEERELRACYYKEGRLQARPPDFPARDWVKVLAEAFRDPTYFTPAQARTLMTALRERIEASRTSSE
jgi:hypothetical protein